MRLVEWSEYVIELCIKEDKVYYVVIINDCSRWIRESVLGFDRDEVDAEVTIQKMGLKDLARRCLPRW